MFFVLVYLQNRLKLLDGLCKSGVRQQLHILYNSDHYLFIVYFIMNIGGMLILVSVISYNWFLYIWLFFLNLHNFYGVY